MPLARRSRRSSIDIWPGFVDALSQLLMVIIFLVLVFTAVQFYLSAALSGRNQALQKLQLQVDQLADMLSVEKTTNSKLRQGAVQLTAQLKNDEAERRRLNAQIASLTASTRQATAQAEQSSTQLAAQKQISASALAQVDQLNADVAALRQQLSAIAAALDISQGKVKSQQTQIADLGQKLNVALASKVQELARYRSEFFGRLRQILGNQPDIHIVGDRFVFQSEVLFAPGSADLTAAAKNDLDPVFTTLQQIAAEIPPGLHWVLQVSGYTDKRPIDTPQFPSNWELSTARALSVVRYAISKGIPADRLAGAGFADSNPIDPGDTPQAYAKNRRIELKLTER
jgi:chemotaxis protein MotB